MIRPLTRARKAESDLSKAKRLIDPLRKGCCESLDDDGVIRLAMVYAAEVDRVSAERERLYKILKMNTGIELKRSALSGWDALTGEGIKLVRQIPTKHKAYLAAVKESAKLAREGLKEIR